MTAVKAVARVLATVAVYGLVASLAAGPLLLAAAVLPAPAWASLYLLAVLLVVALYGWWRAHTRSRDAESAAWRASVRVQELRQRLDTYRQDADTGLDRLLDTGES